MGKISEKFRNWPSSIILLIILLTLIILYIWIQVFSKLILPNLWYIIMFSSLVIGILIISSLYNRFNPTTVSKEETPKEVLSTITLIKIIEESIKKKKGRSFKYYKHNEFMQHFIFHSSGEPGPFKQQFRYILSTFMIVIPLLVIILVLFQQRPFDEILYISALLSIYYIIYWLIFRINLIEYNLKVLSMIFICFGVLALILIIFFINLITAESIEHISQYTLLALSCIFLMFLFMYALDPRKITNRAKLHLYGILILAYLKYSEIIPKNIASVFKNFIYAWDEFISESMNLRIVNINELLNVYYNKLLIEDVFFIEQIKQLLHDEFFELLKKSTNSQTFTKINTLIKQSLNKELFLMSESKKIRYNRRYGIFHIGSYIFGVITTLSSIIIPLIFIFT